MLQDYRNAVAGALVTICVWAAAAFGVEIPVAVGAAAVTIVVFALGFLPRPNRQPEQPPRPIPGQGIATMDDQ